MRVLSSEIFLLPSVGLDAEKGLPASKGRGGPGKGLLSVVEGGPGLHFLARCGPASPVNYRGLLNPSDKHLYLCLQHPMGRGTDRQLIEQPKRLGKNRFWKSGTLRRPPQ